MAAPRARPSCGSTATAANQPSASAWESGLGPALAEPTAGQPPRRRRRPASRILLGLLAGLLVGLLVFGAVGYRAGIRGPLASAATDPAGSTSDVFGGDQALATLASSWLPVATGCAADTTDAEATKAHVSCTSGKLSVHFVRYDSVARRDEARKLRREQHADAKRLAPGATHLLRRPSASQRTRGEYIEYTYVSGEGADAPIVAGVWWDDRDTPLATYVEARWADGLGDSWTPLREAWQKHS